MTPHFHRLDAEADRDFLARGETDPFTGVAFRATNTVVQAADGTVLLRETWEALGESYGGSAGTLAWGAASGDGVSAYDAEPPVVASGIGAAAAVAAIPAGGAAAAPPEAIESGTGAAAAAALGASASGAPEATPRARTAPPRAPRGYMPPPSEPEPEKGRSWLVPLLSVLGIALLLVVGFLVASRLTDQPEPAPVVVEEVAEPTAPQAVALAAGEFVGSLEDGDRQAGGRYEDRFTFVADSSGRVITLALDSPDFRPDLVAVGPDGQRYEAQASGEDAVRIDNLRGPGRFEILVTSREPGGEGAYALQIRQETPIQPLAANGQTTNAVLGQRSLIADGFYRDTYEFSAEAEREYTLAFASSAFEVVPTLTRGSTRIAPRGGEFVFTPEADGRYRLVVTSREKGKRGAYTLNLKAGPKAQAPVVEPPRVRALTPNAPPSRDSIKAGEQVTYTFAGRVGDRVRVDTRALGFAPSIVLVGPDGRRVPGTTTDERANVRETLATAGTYRVIVTSGEADGTFQISMEKTEAPRAADIPRMPGIDAPRQEPAPRQEGGGQQYTPQPIERR